MHLLTVDDDPDFLATLREELEEFGYSVQTAESGPKALALLRHERFDAVLLDVMMPGMSGDEVARRIRNQRRLDGLPIVLLTCLSDARTISDSILSGANFYVSKTAAPEVMLEVIRQAILLSQKRPAMVRIGKHARVDPIQSAAPVEVDPAQPDERSDEHPV